MGLKLYRPGTIIERSLPDHDDVVVRCKYPDEQTARELRECMGAMNDEKATSKEELEMLHTMAKKHFGSVIESIEGVDCDGNGSLRLEVDGGGKLTPDSFASVVPIAHLLVGVISGFLFLTEKDKKNF
jgi:hypothetical protein